MFERRPYFDGAVYVGVPGNIVLASPFEKNKGKSEHLTGLYGAGIGAMGSAFPLHVPSCSVSRFVVKAGSP